MKLSK